MPWATSVQHTAQALGSLLGPGGLADVTSPGAVTLDQVSRPGASTGPQEGLLGPGVPAEGNSQGKVTLGQLGLIQQDRVVLVHEISLDMRPRDATAWCRFRLGSVKPHLGAEGLFIDVFTTPKERK